MSSKSKLWQFLLDRGQATNSEIAEFMRGSKGQLSWGQRLRELRKDLQRKGGNLTCHEVKPGIYLYKVLLPEPPRPAYEEMIAQDNLRQETIINTKEVNRQREFALL